MRTVPQILFHSTEFTYQMVCLILFSGKNYVHPVVLSQYDVVLTTYEVLRREIHFTDLTEEKRYF